MIFHGLKLNFLETTMRSEARKIAVELCKKHPEHTARGLARILQDRVNGAMTLEQCRNVVRDVFGTRGSARAKYAEVPRQPREPGKRHKPRPMDWIPKAQAEEWKPYTLEGKHIGIISDIHIPYHDERALRSSLLHLKSSKIDHLLINGDLCDFYSISRFLRKPSKRKLKNEMEQCRTFLRGLRKEFPSIKITLKKGNHEARWDHWLWDHAPEIADTDEMDLRTWLRCDELGISVVHDLDLMEFGKLPILHGHELGKGIAAPVNPARGAYLRAKHTILVSHHHRTSSHCESNLYLDECQVWSIGCLCDLRPDYHKYGNSNHGFAEAWMDKSGEFSVQNYRISKEYRVRSS